MDETTRGHVVRVLVASFGCARRAHEKGAGSAVGFEQEPQEEGS